MNRRSFLSLVASVPFVGLAAEQRQRKESKALAFLKKDEWTMGNGQCPTCYGLAVGHFWHHGNSLGHEPNCKRAEAIKELGGEALMISDGLVCDRHGNPEMYGHKSVVLREGRTISGGLRAMPTEPKPKINLYPQKR